MNELEVADGEGYIELTAADAPQYIGKTVLIGLTYCDRRGNVLWQYQHHGVIAAVDHVISVRIDGRPNLFTVPPALRPAPPGVYTLRESGLQIASPDVLAEWTIFEPDRNWNAVMRSMHSARRTRARRNRRRAARQRSASAD